MSADISSISPFQPHQPVEPSLFVGRKLQINKVLQRASQSVAGQLRVIYISGQKGIGKTSLANRTRTDIKNEFDTFGFHLFYIGKDGLETKEDFIFNTVNQIVELQATEKRLVSKMRNFLKKYIDEVEVELGFVKIKKNLVKSNFPKQGADFLKFINNLDIAITDNDEGCGIVLIFDEIDSIASKHYFSDFIKELSDTSALLNIKTKLLILICGTPERYQQIIKNESRIADIMDYVLIERLDDSEVEDFFKRAFRKVGKEVLSEALDILVSFSHGQPQLMQLVGEATFHSATHYRAIDKKQACFGVRNAAEDFGRKIIDPKIQQLVRSKVYNSMMEALFANPIEMRFTRRELIDRVLAKDKNRVDAFLQRLKTLGIIKKADRTGEWKFKDRLASLYIQMQSDQKRLIRDNFELEVLEQYTNNSGLGDIY